MHFAVPIAVGEHKIEGRRRPDPFKNLGLIFSGKGQRLSLVPASAACVGAPLGSDVASGAMTLDSLDLHFLVLRCSDPFSY